MSHFYAEKRLSTFVYVFSYCIFTFYIYIVSLGVLSTLSRYNYHVLWQKCVLKRKGWQNSFDEGVQIFLCDTNKYLRATYGAIDCEVMNI